MPIYYKDGLKFDSNTGNDKKYKVITPKGRIIYFGNKNYSQFNDKIGHYKDKNNNDPERRRLYRIRHRNDNLNDKESAGYYSWHYLW